MQQFVTVSPIYSLQFFSLKTNDNDMSTVSLLVEIDPKVKARLASSALDDEPMDTETKEKIEEALKDLEEGRSLTSQQIREMLE